MPEKYSFRHLFGSILASKIDTKTMQEHIGATHGAARTHCDSFRAVTGTRRISKDFSSGDGKAKIMQKRAGLGQEGRLSQPGRLSPEPLLLATLA